VIKLYFLQPRKENGPSFEQLGMIGGIHKKFLLDTEFFGQVSNVEYVTLSIEDKKGPRVVRRYSLDELILWSETRLTNRLPLISEALDRLDERGDVQSRRRIIQRPESSMPLFD
jgi:hypothetical protein